MKLLKIKVMHSLHFLSILSLLNYVSNCVTDLDNPKTKLKLLNVVFRHGDRLPNITDNGYLTEKGKLRANELGRELRQRYNDFLGNVYKPYQILSRSTRYNRTEESLKFALAGLYPNIERAYWDKMPIYSVEIGKDILLIPFYCPRVQDLLSRVEELPEVQKEMEPFQGLMQNLSLFSGMEIKTDQDLSFYYGNLVCLKSIYEPNVPEWLDSLLANEQFVKGSLLSFNHLRYNLELQKLNGGGLTRKILQNMIEKIFLNLQQKMYLYSAHDLNVQSILDVFKLWDNTFPNFSSAVIVELHEGVGRYYVTVVHYKGIPAEFEVMQLPGCSTLCPLEQFVNLVADQLPNNSELVC